MFILENEDEALAHMTLEAFPKLPDYICEIIILKNEKNFFFRFEK
jgi:hypothetical protein